MFIPGSGFCIFRRIAMAASIFRLIKGRPVGVFGLFEKAILPPSQPLNTSVIITLSSPSHCIISRSISAFRACTRSHRATAPASVRIILSRAPSGFYKKNMPCLTTRGSERREPAIMSEEEEVRPPVTVHNLVSTSQISTSAPLQLDRLNQIFRFSSFNRRKVLL